MPKHNINFTIPENDLGHADVIFQAFEDEEKIGKLKISKGAVVWTPKDGKKGWKVSWAKLGALIVENGNRE